jgi:hypothetical protein
MHSFQCNFHRDIASATDNNNVKPYRTYTAHTASVEVRQSDRYWRALAGSHNPNLTIIAALLTGCGMAYETRVYLCFSGG